MMSAQATVETSSRLTLNLDTKTIQIASLAEARAKVMEWVRHNDISASEYGLVSGRIERDGVPYCRVSYFGKLWALDDKGRETFREMSDDGRVAP